MLSIVMACLLFIMMVSLPLPLTADAKPFNIYLKASIYNIDPDISSKFLSEQLDTISPHIPTTKRSTMLLNKLMHALHKALDNENEEVVKDTPDVVPVIVDNYPSMDLHRRGEDRLTRYWRCYFNAVSCF